MQWSTSSITGQSWPNCPVHRFLEWIELSPRKFGRWQQRFGKVKEHNGLVPRNHQIEPLFAAGLSDLRHMEQGICDNKASAHTVSGNAATADEGSC